MENSPLAVAVQLFSSMNSIEASKKASPTWSVPETASVAAASATKPMLSSPLNHIDPILAFNSWAVIAPATSPATEETSPLTDADTPKNVASP